VSRPALVHAAIVLATLACGALLRLPALDAFLLADDYDHLAMQQGVYPVARSRLDRFRFADSDPDERRALLASGRLPWWTHEDLQLSVLRPLPSLLVELDHFLWGSESRPRHLHNLLWWAAFVVAAAGLFRCLLPAPAAAFATLLFALEEGHSLPLVWTANRSAFIAGALSVAALQLHIRKRRAGAPHGHRVSWLLWALSLSAGEHALGGFALLIAFELAGNRQRPWTERLTALAPAALLSLGYITLTAVLGYGIAGSGFYISPLSSPLAFLEAGLVRLPTLLADLVFSFPADWHIGGSPLLLPLQQRGLLPADPELAQRGLREFQVALGLVAALLLAAAVHFGRRFRMAATNELDWLPGGALLALVPACGTLPMSRLTLLSAIAIDAALALLALAALRRLSRAPWPGRAVAALALSGLVAAHLLHASHRSRLESEYYSLRSRAEHAWAASAELGGAELARRHVLIVSALDWISAWGLRQHRALMQRSIPRSVHMLSGSQLSAHRLRRSGPHSLELELLSPAGDRSFAGSCYRPRAAELHPGARFENDVFRVEVLRSLGGQPAALRFVFAHSLDDPRYLLLHATPLGLRQLSPPALGQTLTLPPAAFGLLPPP